MVDAPMAQQMRQDHSAQKVALIALGRPIRAGDYLALVAVNIATRELTTGYRPPFGGTIMPNVAWSPQIDRISFEARFAIICCKLRWILTSQWRSMAVPTFVSTHG
jgi:hypothetical protein